MSAPRSEVSRSTHNNPAPHSQKGRRTIFTWMALLIFLLSCSIFAWQATAASPYPLFLPYVRGSGSGQISSTPTNTPTATLSSTATSTPTPSATPTLTPTPTITGTFTATPTPSATPTQLSSPGFAVAAGSAGTTLHWDGQAWARVSNPSGTTQTLPGVQVFSSGNAWVAGGGGSGYGDQKFILHWDGSTWAKWSPLPGNTIYIAGNMSFVSPSLGYAVTYYTGSYPIKGELLRWNGTDWSLIYTDTIRYNGVSALGLDNVWVIGIDGTESSIRHWNGSYWSTVYTSFSMAYLRGIAMRTAQDGWMVGDHGLAARWNGSDWIQTDTGLGSTVTLFQVQSSGADEAWAVGSGGTLLHWQEGAWTPVSSPTTRDLYALDFSSSTNGWAVGSGGTILHYDGSAWTLVASPVRTDLYAVSVAP